MNLAENADCLGNTFKKIWQTLSEPLVKSVEKDGNTAVSFLHHWVTQQAEQIHKTVADPYVWNGSLAGDVLLYVLSMHCYHPPASVHKAVLIVEDYAQKAKDFYGQRRGWRSGIMSIWGRYKPAAHLWAAHRALSCHGGNTIPLATDHPFNFAAGPEELLNFLAMAEAFRQNAIKIVAPGQTIPVLDPAETWRVPDTLHLPSVFISVPQLDDLAHAVLRNYFKNYRSPEAR